MRRRGLVVVLAFASAFAWLGCNALLGIESAVFEPDGGGSSGALDTGRPPDEDSSSRADVSASDASDAADVAHPCTITAADPFNCGTCGHDCLGGACSGGLCQPFVVANEPGEPIAIAVDTTHVYWTVGDDLRRAPITGGAAQTVFDGPTGTYLGEGLVRSGPDVYFTIGDADGGVFRCPSAGCGAAGPVPVVAPLDSPGFVGLAEGGVLLFSEGTVGGRVGRCTLPCTSGVDFVASGEGLPGFVGSASGGVYWSTVLPGPGNVRGRMDGAGVATTLVAGDSIAQVDVNGDEVLFVVRGVGVKGAARDGGTQRRIYGPSIPAERFVVDGPFIYFDEGLLTGRVLRCPLVGCGDAGTTMASSQQRPYAIAVDKTSIYWTNRGDFGGGGAGGSIVRLAK